MAAVNITVSLGGKEGETVEMRSTEYFPGSLIMEEEG